MGTADEKGERATVMTYVPVYQKERWKEHADALGMSQSEFVRTMVQAGRRDFEVPGGPFRDDDPRGEDGGNGDEEGVSEFGERVIDALAASEFRSWDELLDELTADTEDRLEATLQRLQSNGRVQHSGRHGGYTLTSKTTEGSDER
jgi:hypothetical protein